MNDILDQVVNYIPAFIVGLLPTSIAVLGLFKSWIKNAKVDKLLEDTIMNNVIVKSSISGLQAEIIKTLNQLENALLKN